MYKILIRVFNLIFLEELIFNKANEYKLHFDEYKLLWVYCTEFLTNCNFYLKLLIDSQQTLIECFSLTASHFPFFFFFFFIHTFAYNQVTFFNIVWLISPYVFNQVLIICCFKFDIFTHIRICIWMPLTNSIDVSYEIFLITNKNQI